MGYKKPCLVLDFPLMVPQVQCSFRNQAIAMVPQSSYKLSQVSLPTPASILSHCNLKEFIQKIMSCDGSCHLCSSVFICVYLWFQILHQLCYVALRNLLETVTHT